MEGVLELFEPDKRGVFTSGVWKKVFFILHREVLMFTDLVDKSQVRG
jgi:hypothetical protein